MSHILVYARSRSQLEKARIFLESSGQKNITYDYVFFHRWEDEKQGYRYDANIDRLLHRSSYSAIIFWGIPNEYKYRKNIPYFIVFENADHILYPSHKKKFILLFWWQELQRKKWMKHAHALISIHPRVRQHLCDEIKENSKDHYCLPTHLPLITQKEDAKLSRDFAEFQPEIISIIGTDYLRANIVECLDITNGDITFLTLSSNQNATTHLFRQIHAWEQSRKWTQESEEIIHMPRIARYQDAFIRASQPNYFTQWLVLLDLHLTSGISDTLSYALEIGAPIVTLNNSSLSQELRNIDYPYIFSLARTHDMKNSLWELRGYHHAYTRAREIIEDLSKSYKKNTLRSSEHMHFLIEKSIEPRKNEKIV